MDLKVLQKDEITDLAKHRYDRSHPEYKWQIKLDLELAERRREKCDAWAKRHYRDLGTCKFCARKGFPSLLGIEAWYDLAPSHHPLGQHANPLAIVAVCGVRGCRDRANPKVLVSNIDPSQF